MVVVVRYALRKFVLAPSSRLSLLRNLFLTYYKTRSNLAETSSIESQAKSTLTIRPVFDHLVD